MKRGSDFEKASDLVARIGCLSESRGWYCAGITQDDDGRLSIILKEEEGKSNGET